jgi:hypothetical protein
MTASSKVVPAQWGRIVAAVLRSTLEVVNNSLVEPALKASTQAVFRHGYQLNVQVRHLLLWLKITTGRCTQVEVLLNGQS